MREKVPLWYTPAQHSELHLHADIPINTAVVMPIFSFEIQQEFYVIFFACERLEVSGSSGVGGSSTSGYGGGDGGGGGRCRLVYGGIGENRFGLIM